ncbi:MAG: PaaI family thioesterase [Myxococcota bacterium]
MEFVRSWIEKSGYSAALGVELAELSEQAATLRLPFREENSNPGKALHGGCAASLGVIGGHAVARAALGEASGPWHTVSVQVNYLAAAIDEDVTAQATLLRRGKELCFVEVDVAREDGKPIAHVTAAVRGRFGAEPCALATSPGDHGESEPGKMGPHMGRLPFGAARGFDVEHMVRSTSRITMPASQANADAAGGVHEGAALALLDTTGAMAAWAETGPGPYKASTPSLQACILAPPPDEALVAYGRTVQRDAEILWAEVEVAGQQTAKVCARGTVIYRIVT